VGRVSVPLSIWLPLAIFGLTRIYDFVAISLAARQQVALPSPAHPGIYQFTAHPASPGYLALITNWDGQWYERIATLGYHLPAVGAGASVANDALWTYNFLPGFPVVVGALMALTGLSFAVCVTLVNLVAGGAAMVVMFNLVERTAGWFVAGAAVLLTCCFVAAPLFQAAYNESISLLLVCTVLLLIARRRYAWAVPVIVLLSLTRPLTPPLAIVVLVHAGLRLRNRARDPIRLGEAVWMTVLAVVSAVSVLVWPTVTSLITRQAKTTGTRRSVSNAVVTGRFGWFTNAYEHIGWIGVAGLALLVLLLVALALSPLTRMWGVEVRTWFAIYPIYLLFVVGVHTGVLRYLLLAFPLAMLTVGSPQPGTLPRKRAALVVIVSVIGLALQAPWVAHALVVTQLAGKPWLP
jgi:hypothetical protein